MSLKGLLIAAILIIWSLIALAKLHWNIDVVYWLVFALGLVWLIDEVFGLPAIKRVRRTKTSE